MWENLPSSAIARGFVLAYRVADKVIVNKGGNAFLVSNKEGNTLHANVRRDFVSTDKGIAPKTE